MSVITLPLDDLGAPDVPGGYIYLPPPPFVLRFVIEGASSICRNGVLRTNIPEGDKAFDRSKWQEFELSTNFGRSVEIDVPVNLAGAFSFSVSESTQLHYIDVSPKLTLNGESLPLDALSVFSVISKFMGEYPADWNRHFKGIADRGYNMVHFTPLIERGSSNSPYSIYDQLKFDHFTNGEDDVTAMIKRMEHEHGLLSLTDVVWNHTANNSKWLEHHPEAGYNVKTAPWLESALELDDALLAFSATLEGVDIANTGELRQIMSRIDLEILQKLKLWEYYVIDVEKNSRSILSHWRREKGPKSAQRLADKIPSFLGARFARTVDPRIGASLLSNSFTEAEAKTEIVRALDDLNLPLYKEYDDDKAQILEQLQNRIKYMRLDSHGPKLGPISSKAPLIESYFTRLPRVALVNNGWMWNADAMKDHAGQDSKAYLRREIIVWGDCVKLRYGSRPEDNPWLWKYMAEYTQLMAKHFAGFRIDNCHSTPLVVAEYLLDKAREIRPNLVVCAELFTGSEEMDYLFVKRLGISFLIREAMQAWSTQEMSRLVHKHGGRPIGSFDFTGNTEVHALFMDCTHDNEVPAQKRDARDTLPNAALVSMCDCATGSVMGYDEVYPRLIDLVNETRHYEFEATTTGIGKVKKILNDIHTRMGKDGYSEMYVHHEGEFITVHRVHPITRHGYFLVAHTAYPGSVSEGAVLTPVNLTGTLAQHVGSWKLQVDKKKQEEGDMLRGIPSQLISLQDPDIVTSNNGGAVTIKLPSQFPPGSIALFETSLSAEGTSLSAAPTNMNDGVQQAFASLDLIDLNFVLYRCDAEERASSSGKDGVYNIPGHGPLVYAGLQGWWSVLRDVIRDNNLGHPICDHLRAGCWALDYIVNRLARYKAVAAWFQLKFDAIRLLPSFLLPRYFALAIQAAYTAACDRAVGLMSPNIRNGQKFLQELAMVSVQQVGLVPSASLYPTEVMPTLAAGLPHFSTDWARCWGRDIFISLRGLLLGTGRFDVAKSHILAFASVLKHGMIPNLLSSGRLPRYNARDSVWFFLQSIQDYVTLVPDGKDLLGESVKRRFLPYDDTFFEYDDPRAYSKSSTIAEIVQEVLQRHASGLSFREANAGPQLDMQMKPEGFQIDVHVDWEDTGFIFGGNQWNCGTWQDKMGESEKAGNKGIPGTSRDGAAVEIIGLLYSALVWADQACSFHSVTTLDGATVTLKDWASRIKANFEKHFFHKGVYMDIYPSSNVQLRANFPIAMCVAPSLFTPELAREALALADSILLRGPIGMATLDPNDPDYRPYYVNSEDSHDFATAKGRNYHQGPEWVWPRGYFLRAFVKFGTTGPESSQQEANRRLQGCKKAIKESPWAGLPELTQKDGQFCPDSVSPFFFSFSPRLNTLLTCYRARRKPGPQPA